MTGATSGLPLVAMHPNYTQYHLFSSKWWAGNTYTPALWTTGCGSEFG